MNITEGSRVRRIGGLPITGTVIERTEDTVLLQWDGHDSYQTLRVDELELARFA